jgi:hypothetical protein
MNYGKIEKVSLWLAENIFWPMVQFLLALAGAVFVTARLLMAAGAMQAQGLAFNDGPSPTSMTSGNMPQAKYTIHYNKVFMKWLAANLVHMRLCTRQTLDPKSGQTNRNFMLVPPGPNLTQQPEGTIGSPISVACNFRDIVYGQWADYLNFSDFSFLTSISNDLENYRRAMAYRLAFTIDNLIMINFDYLRTLDANTANQDSLLGPLYPFSKQIIEQMPASLLGAKVNPFPTGFFYGKIHPFFVGDLTALDNSNNSIVDIMKHTPEGQLRLKELTDDGGDGEEPIRVLEMFGVRWLSSTNCTQTANWQGSGLTGLSTYCAGEDAMIFGNLPAANHTDPHPRWENMNLWAGTYSRSSYDPAGVIAAGTSYNTILGIGPTPDTVSRARIAIAVPQTT